MTHPTGEEKALRATIARVRARIVDVTAQLAPLDPRRPSGVLHVVNVEDSASFEQWIARCKEARLREALLLDLVELRAQLKLLQADVASVRRRHAWAVGEALLALTKRRSVSFKKKTQQKLETAAKNKSLPDGELRGLARESEAILNDFITVLDAAPNDRNMRLTVEHMEVSLLLGASTDAGPVSRALASLRRANRRLLDAALAVFRRKPTREHAKPVLDRLRQAALLGTSYSELTPIYAEVHPVLIAK